MEILKIKKTMKRKKMMDSSNGKMSGMMFGLNNRLNN